LCGGFSFLQWEATIEAFFKIAKNTYGIKNLRTSKFYGIYTFLWLMAMTHNLITWFKETKLEGTELKGAGVKTLVENRVFVQTIGLFFHLGFILQLPIIPIILL